jgi:hypothetical protein
MDVRKTAGSWVAGVFHELIMLIQRPAHVRARMQHERK